MSGPIAPPKPSSQNGLTDSSQADSLTNEFSVFISQWADDLSLNLVSLNIDPLLGSSAELEHAHLRVGAVLQAFDSNPEIKRRFLLWVNAQKGASNNAEAQVDFDTGLRLLGLLTASSYFFISQLSNKVSAKSIAIDAKTEMFVKPLSQLLPYAYLARSAFEDGNRNQELAFTSGLFFDYVAYQIEVSDTEISKVKTAQFLASRFELALKVAQVAVVLAKHRQTLALEKDVIPLIFLEAVSQAVFSIHHQSFIDFTKQVEKLATPPTFIDLAEIRLFRSHHSTAGVASTQAFGIFSRLADSLLYLNRSQILNTVELEDQFHLTALVFLSFFIVRNAAIFKDRADSVPASSLCPELAEFDQLVPFASIFGGATSSATGAAAAKPKAGV